MFKAHIQKLFDAHLSMEALFFDEGSHLRALVEGGFLEPAFGLSKSERAVVILDLLFSRLTPAFHFALFFDLIATKKEKEAFLSCLLFHIFSLTLPLEHLRSKAELEAYLFRCLATVSSKRCILRLWNTLSFTQQVKSYAFACNYYDEGSFELIRACKTIQPSLDALWQMIWDGRLQAKEFWQWAHTQNSISKSALAQFIQMARQDQERRIIKLQEVISHHYKRLFTIEELTHFVSVFGLFGHQIPPNAPFLQEYESLDEQLEAVYEFQQSESHGQSHERGKDTEEKKGVTDFSNRLFSHLVTLTDHPDIYAEGLKKILYAMPTCGRNLEKQGCLESLLEGFKTISKTLGVADSEFALFVFDQSDEKRLISNKRYISRLQKRYKTQIIHLDKSELITLAKKHNALDLIITGPNERFGYTGARNAIFLLGPYLHEKVYQKGTAIDEISIMMCDDDLLIPTQNFFSDALFAYEQRKSYFCRVGFIVGRTTTEVYGALEPTTCFTQANKILSQSQWSEKQTLHLMATLLCKPKICINLPFGQEENHLIPLENTYFDFRRAALHQAGWRYPATTLPTNRYSGLAGHLKSLNSYVLGLGLVTDLLDPPNALQRSALPWNEVKRPFSNIQEAAECITAPNTIKQMKQLFWQNFHNYFQPLAAPKEVETSHHSAIIFKVLLSKKIDTIISEQRSLHPYMIAFKKELNELKHFFHMLFEEATWMKQFALEVDRKVQQGHDPSKVLIDAKVHIEAVSQKPIEQHYFTNHIYTFCQVIGTAQFQQALRAALPLF